MGVSKNSGTPKSSILIGFSIINHPFWGTPIFGNIHMVIYMILTRYRGQVMKFQKFYFNIYSPCNKQFAPANRPKPTRKGSYSNHPFLGANCSFQERLSKKNGDMIQFEEPIFFN